ncbi:MAG: hypothetical protein U5K31_02075 [Balneolaceae bacterium]|nr:hypothetical protein [Balneolaceae bacterium]
MKDNLFDPYYKLGLNHFVFKQLMHLKRPSSQVQAFYLTLIFVILSLAMLIG